MFSTVPEANFNFLFTIILLSANAFNLDKSKFLSFGKELTLSQTTKFRLFQNELKTLWEKKKLLVMSNFSLSHNIFKGLVLQTRKNQGLFGKGLIRS